MRLILICLSWFAVWMIAALISPNPEPLTAANFREWWIMFGSVAIGSIPSDKEYGQEPEQKREKGHGV